MFRKVVIPVAAATVFVPAVLGVSMWFAWKLTRSKVGLFNVLGGV